MALLAVGALAPAFTGKNLTGPDINLEYYRHKKAVCLIFAPDTVDPSWTTPGKGLAAKWQDKVEIIIVVRNIPSVLLAKVVLNQLGIKFPVVYDAAQALFKAFGVESPVAVFVIDVNGNIILAAQLGRQINPETFEDTLVAALK